MEEKLNSIPITGKWNEIATRINSNLSKIEGELTRLGLSTYKSKGYFSSEEELKSLFENPKDGDWAVVDEYIYLVENKSWYKTDKLFNTSVELKEYIKKNGSAESLTIDGIPITDVLDEKLDANGGSADGLLINGDKRLKEEINSKISRILSFDGIITKEMNITIQNDDDDIPAEVEEILFAESFKMFVARIGGEYYKNWAFNGDVQIHNHNGTARTDCAYIDSDGSAWFFDGKDFIKYAHRNKNFTSNSRLNNVIKEIYIEGGIDKELYITRLFHKYKKSEEEKNLCLIEIRDQDKNIVCVYGDNIEAADHVPPTIVKLKEQNNSGISGYAVIEWDKVETTIAWFSDNDQNAKISPASNKIELCPTIYTYKRLSDFSEFKASTINDIDTIIDDLSDTNTALTEESNRAKEAEKNIEDSVVKHTEQELSPQQRNQARSNIRAVGYSGTYGNTVVLNVDGEIYYPEGIATSIKMSNGVDNVEGVLIETKRKVETFLQDADTSEQAIDKLKELQDYIAEDKSGASQMLESIGANSRAIEGEIERATNKENEISDSLQSEVNRAQQVEEQLETKKADKTGYYENMSVGVSDNLSGRGESSNAEFAMRPSGGENKSIEDGVARINSIRGNSVVLNQFVDNFKKVGEKQLTANFDYEITSDEIILTCHTGGVLNKSYLFGLSFGANISVGDNVYASIKCKTSFDCTISVYPAYNNIGLINPDNSYKKYSFIGTINKTSSNSNVLYFTFVGFKDISLNVGDEIRFKKPQFTNLTKMFGKGKEPTTVEEFELLYSNMLDEYNEGTIIDNHTKAIKSVGVNILDVSGDILTPPVTSSNPSTPKDWAEVGKIYSHINGDGYVNTNKESVIQKNINGISVKNDAGRYGVGFFAKCIPNAKYTIHANKPSDSIIILSEYDKNKVYIRNYYFSKTTSEIQLTKDTHYVFLVMAKSNNYDTAVEFEFPIMHLTHTGYLNDQYEPYPQYEDFIRELPTVEGGLKSALNAYDEIRYNVSKDKWEYIKRIGVVDLGTLNWEKWNIVENEEQHLRFRAEMGDKFNGFKDSSKIYNIINKRYNSISTDDTWRYIKGISMAFITGTTYKSFVIYDDAYTVDDAAKLKANLSGVMCYYELEKPIVTELDIELSRDYRVWDYGTEEAINSELSTPVKLNLYYGFNAVGQITDNTILIEELLARVAQLEAKITQVNSVSDTNEEE